MAFQPDDVRRQALPILVEVFSDPNETGSRWGEVCGLLQWETCKILEALEQAAIDRFEVAFLPSDLCDVTIGHQLFAHNVSKIQRQTSFGRGLLDNTPCKPFTILNSLSFKLTKNLFPNCSQGNYFSLVFNGTICLVGISGSTVYFYLNARMLAERFTHVTQKLQNFAYGREPIDPVKIDKLLLQFNILIDELHKCNFFWSKMMAFNYYISLAICCTEILVGECWTSSV